MQSYIIDKLPDDSSAFMFPFNYWLQAILPSNPPQAIDK